MGNSFPPISSIGANGAIIHYSAKKETAAKMSTNEVYLLDSGGQYLDGTTDITRTVHMGTPTEEERDRYTRVLLGNLDIERTRFPKGRKISGIDIDILARRWLHMIGLDYPHSTGHGVGYYSGVHESPPGLGRWFKEEYVVGHVMSNEPGYYTQEGGYGIRIENVILVEEVQEGFLGFLNMTLVPYCKNLLKADLLSRNDIKYINEYHKRCMEEVGPILKEMKWDLGYKWLVKHTTPMILHVELDMGLDTPISETAGEATISPDAEPSA